MFPRCYTVGLLQYICSKTDHVTLFSIDLILNKCFIFYPNLMEAQTARETFHPLHFIYSNAFFVVVFLYVLLIRKRKAVLKIQILTK